MKKTFLQSLSLVALAFCVSAITHAQTTTTSADTKAKAVTDGVKDPTPATAITPTTSPVDLARAAVAAQGGDKFKALKNVVLRGSVDLYGPGSTQSLPGGFLIASAGDKLRLEVNAGAFSFKQIYDGQQSYSSLPRAEMPPEGRFGMRALAKFDQDGYTVTALPDKKKQRGFRIADAEGNTTDFYIDAVTARVITFTYSYNGINYGTENTKFKDVEGVLIASSFTRRIEMPQGAAFAEFNAKDIKINQALGDDAFQIPN
jgi:hypothetical protein